MLLVIKKKLTFIIFLFNLLFIVDSLNAQESIIIRTDRDTYIGGEGVWLAIDCVRSGTAQISDLSKVAYVELLNRNNVPVHQFKLKLENGKASTQFVLSDTISTGNYLLRGYTKWMKNYNTDFFFNKTISIVNPFVKNRFPESDKANRKDTVLFYPEGGEIILNVDNHICFQCVDVFNNGIEITAEIITDDNSIIDTIETNRYGFGDFSFHPRTLQDYKIRFEIGKKAYTLTLPKVIKDGHLLQLTESEEKIRFKVKRLENERPERPILHIASATGELIEIYNINEDKGEFQVEIDRNKYPNQYLCAILLSQTGEVLASRYFVTSIKPKEDPFSITFNSKQQRTREEVVLGVEKNKKLSSVTLSVVKKCLLNQSFPIHNLAKLNSYPKYLLTNYSDSEMSINDLLMCFIPYKKVLDTGGEINFLPEGEGEIISGRISNKMTLEPISNEKLILNFVSHNPTIEISRTDSSGRFCFISNKFGLNEMVIQPLKNEKSKIEYRIDLDESFSNKYEEGNIIPFFMDSAKAIEINNAILSMQIADLFVGETSLKEEDLVGNKTCFYGEPEFTIPIEKFIDLPTMEEVISEIIPFTSLQKRDGNYNIKIIDEQPLAANDVESFILVDGVHINDEESVLNIEPAVIDRIEVVNKTYFIEDNVLGRIFSVFTKAGDLNALDFDNRIFRQARQCFYPNYRFSSIDYSVDSLKNSRIPDFRNLLYWSKEVNFNESDFTEVSFFTSDEIGDYLIIVEGLNESGEIERSVLEYSVIN